jgi:hypothetical protein
VQLLFARIAAPDQPIRKRVLSGRLVKAGP